MTRLESPRDTTGERMTVLKMSFRSALLPVLTASAFAMLSAAAHSRDLWIDNVTVVSPERAAPLTAASVHIHEDRIAGISTGKHAGAIDGTGLYLTPGLIDSHVHLSEIPGMRQDQEQAHPDIARAAREQFPKTYLYYGFTTLVDLISIPEVMRQWSSAPVHPDTYFCGGASVLNGYPTNFVPLPMRYQYMPYFFIDPAAPASAGKLALPPGVDPAEHTPQSVVRRMKTDGAICVKTFFERGFGPFHDLPVPELETARAVVLAAHAAGMPVLMHANSFEAQTFALAAGVDIIAHGLWNWDDHSDTTQLSPAIQHIQDEILSGHRAVQPTIQVLYGEQDLFNESYLANPALRKALPASLIAWYQTPQGQWFHDEFQKSLDLKPGETPPHDMDALPIARVKSCVSYLAHHDARLLFGTDTPSAPTFANPPGLNAHLEMRDLVEAGETPEQLFRSATLANAEAFGLSSEVGTVQAGKRANLLLLRGDPTRSIDAYEHIEKIILHGKVLEPRDLAADRPK
jgi:imidazolonepropionase-like amidohydrolase